MVSAATGADAGVMALMKGSELLASSAVRNAASAITYFTEKGLGWNYNQFAESTFGTGAMAGYLSGMLSTGISMGLDNSIKGYTGELSVNTRTLNSLAGGLASTGLTYAMTGSGVVNLANFNMFGSNISHGLVEMHFGESGNYLKLVEGGTDVSLDRVISGFKGLEAYGENMRIELSSESVKENAVGMRTLYSFGLSEAYELYEEILKGKTELKVDEELDGTAKTEEIEGKKVIWLGKKYFEGDELGRGVILAQEAGRNGRNDGEKGQFAETVGSVILHSIVAGQVAGTYGDSILTGQMKLDLVKLREAASKGDMSSFAVYVGANYDSTADYWKLIKNKDGSHNIEWDGCTGLYDESDKLIMKGEPRSYVNSLRMYMGLGNTEDAEKIIAEKGIELTGRIGSDSDYGETGFMNSSMIEEWTNKQLSEETFKMNNGKKPGEGDGDASVRCMERVYGMYRRYLAMNLLRQLLNTHTCLREYEVALQAASSERERIV